MKIAYAFLCLTIWLSPAASGATRTIVSSLFTFSPDSIAIHPGDTVKFTLASIHTSRQVDESTWQANDTISNGGWDLPPGGGMVILNTVGTYYYVCVPHGSMGMKGRIFVVAAVESTFTIHRNVFVGWNMVSLPVLGTDSAVAALFPGADSRAFGYQGTYVPTPTIATGTGYWLKFSQSQDVPLAGAPLVRDSVASSKGWNMVGSLGFRRPRTSISSSPPGIISSPLFGFNGSYFLADTIEPGEGYWVRLNDSGTLIFDTSTSSAFPLSFEEKVFMRTASHVTIRDALGRGGTLYIAEVSGGPASYPLFSELPPVPPPGAFDLRFATGRSVAILSSGHSGQFPVLLSSAVYPVTVSWNSGHVDDPISLRLDGAAIPLSAAGEIRVTAPARSMSIGITPKGAVPAAYSLSGAYPNPFNPGTIVHYTLPVESRVLLHVYNILGQLVATIVDGIQGPGERSAGWNAGAGGASGIYFIRMDAVPAGGSGEPYSRVVKAILQR